MPKYDFHFVNVTDLHEAFTYPVLLTENRLKVLELKRYWLRCSLFIIILNELVSMNVRIYMYMYVTKNYVFNKPMK